MKIHHTDQDQITMIKDWWHSYGKGLTIAVVLGILLGYGVRFWHAHRTNLMQNASIKYQMLIETQSSDPTNLKSIQAITEDLKTHYVHTPYTSLASLILAQSYVSKEKYNDALTELKWILQHSRDKTFKQIARLHSARILLAQHQPDQALTVLDTIDDSTYQPYINLLKGRIYQIQHNENAAQTNFDTAAKQLTQMQIPYGPLPLMQSTPLTSTE